MGHGDFALAPELRFFMPKTLHYKYTRYGTLIQFKSMFLQHLRYVLENNV